MDGWVSPQTMTLKLLPHFSDTALKTAAIEGLFDLTVYYIDAPGVMSIPCGDVLIVLYVLYIGASFRGMNGRSQVLCGNAET